MITPLISVVLPVYNGEKYITESVDSILRQSFRNFEFIIINDGSTDNTHQILSEYESKDSRIRLISRPNKGLEASINQGIELAHGEWIARMDADDISLPHRFERQLQRLEQTGADICGSWIQFFGLKNQDILKYCINDEAIKFQMLFAAPFAHPTVMMRASLLKQLGCYKAEGMNNCEDYDLWERAARAGWIMANVPEVLLMYRQHGSQISAVATKKQRELTIEVQKRYSKYTADILGLDESAVADVLSMNIPNAKRDMNQVDKVFSEILHRSTGEARQEILDYALRLYIKVAVDCPDIYFRWCKLNEQIGINVSFRLKMKFLLIQLFRIRYGTPAFDRLKKLYLSYKE